MSTRYIIVGTEGDTKDLNLYQDGRTFARKSYAQKMLRIANERVNDSLEIKEVEVISDKERIEALVARAGTAENLIAQMRDKGFDSFECERLFQEWVAK